MNRDCWSHGGLLSLDAVAGGTSGLETFRSASREESRCIAGCYVYCSFSSFGLRMRGDSICPAVTGLYLHSAIKTFVANVGILTSTRRENTEEGQSANVLLKMSLLCLVMRLSGT